MGEWYHSLSARIWSSKEISIGIEEDNRYSSMIQKEDKVKKIWKNLWRGTEEIEMKQTK